MKIILNIVSLFFCVCGFSQTNFHNTGNLKIFEEGAMGFHTHLRNDGLFDDNKGLVGFYSDDPITVSGALSPTFYDMEIMTDTYVSLETTVNVVHNANFISGDFFTPRETSWIHLNFQSNAFYTGESDMTKVNGFSAATQMQNVTFPVGDALKLRPLILHSQEVNQTTKCAYFFEDPNNSSTYNRSFDTESRMLNIEAISSREFWRLEGTVTATLQISWDERSEIEKLTDDVEKIIPVGWNKSEARWESLASFAAVGTLEQGFVSSKPFIPNDYEIISFGALGNPWHFLTPDNYLVTANGDGKNDALEIEELELSPNNHMQIYDRFGLKVFEMPNYTNEFRGYSNLNNFVVDREKALPVGVYFYIVTLKDYDRDFQGFFYLAH
tara:strand:+ start:1561 stop:2709 length:1149 start_codon:yes stop_codon:yes gene_type:complete